MGKRRKEEMGIKKLSICLSLYFISNSAQSLVETLHAFEPDVSWVFIFIVEKVDYSLSYNHTMMRLYIKTLYWRRFLSWRCLIGRFPLIIWVAGRSVNFKNLSPALFTFWFLFFSFFLPHPSIQNKSDKWLVIWYLPRLKPEKKISNNVYVTSNSSLTRRKN
jgi:hypothetical protein